MNRNSILILKREGIGLAARYEVDGINLNQADEAIPWINDAIDIFSGYTPISCTEVRLCIATVDAVSFVSVVKTMPAPDIISPTQKMSILALVKRFRPEITIRSWFTGDGGIYINHAIRF